MAGAPLRLSFSRLSLYAACPLKYRYLEVEGHPEPGVPPDWRHAPAAASVDAAASSVDAVASSVDRSLGLAVHAALLRWQRTVDGGASPRAEKLLEMVRQELGTHGLSPGTAGRAWERVERGLREYAAGPWPRRSTLFLEQSVHHVLEGDGIAVELHLRVDRVVRYLRTVAIIDFKVVSPHAFELRADEWQLRTYALAAPELLGVLPTAVNLFLVDLGAGEDRPVSADRAALQAATAELLTQARGIASGQFDVAEGHADRPCWSCGFRLECPSSLAPDPPPTG